MVSSFRIYAEYTYCETKSCTFGKKIVVNEQLCLLTASNLGIKVPNSFIINSQKMQGENIYLQQNGMIGKFQKRKLYTHKKPIHLKDLARVDDQISKPFSGSQKFTDDHAYEAESDVDFHVTDDCRKRKRKYDL